MRENVDLGVVPRHELAVHPNSLGVCDGHDQSLSDTASPMAEVEPVRTDGSAQALRIRAAAAASPRKSSIMAVLRMAAIGFAVPVPAMSGAEPWTGSNIDGPVRSGLRLADAAKPMPPDTAPPRSVRMSPKRLSVTMTSYCSGDCTK